MPAPIANDDALNVIADTSFVLSIADLLLANDSDPDGDPLTLDGFVQPANGTLIDNGDGTLTYTPNPGFTGQDTFTYTVSDGSLTDSATVTVDVAAGIFSDAFDGAALDPQWSVIGSAQLAAGGGEAYLEIDAAAGSNLWGSSNTSARAMQAAPDADFGIEAKFLSAPTQHHQTQGLLVEQDGSNWLRFDTYRSGTDLYAFAAVTVAGISSVRFNTQIPDGSADYLRITRAGDNWTLDYSADGQTWNTAGSFSHAMTVAEVGTFAASANPSTTFTAEVDYFFNTAAPVADESNQPQAPDAVDDALAAELDTNLSINIAADLLANDTDPNGDTVSLDSFGQPANGTLIDNGDGTLTYTPNTGFTGQDTFTYTATDGGLTDTATVTIDVTDPGGGALPPDAVDDTLAGQLDTNLSINIAADLLANDTDPNGDTVSLDSFGQPANGTLIDNGDGTLTYTPNVGFTGQDTFTYTATDGGLTDTATVTIDVTDPGGGALPPDAVDDTLAGQADTNLSINIAADLLANDTDPNGDTVSLDSFGQPANGTLIDNGDGTLTYTPNAGFTGQDTFTYTATDGGLTDTATVTINVVGSGPQIFSDAFDSQSLNPNWTIVQGTAQLGQQSGEGFLQISASSGTNMFGSDTSASRVMQAAPDQDFGIEAKFLSNPSQHFQTQGLLIEQDASNWMRYDTYRSGSDLYIFAAVTVAGASSVVFNTLIADGSADFLRATRTGDNWTLDYSADGQTWTTAGSFSHAMTVSQVGTFAGSADTSTSFTSQVDYFFNTASPVPDDLFTPPPVAGDDALAASLNQNLVIDVDADLLANDSDPQGDPLWVISNTQPDNGALVDNGDGTWTYTPDNGFLGQDTFDYVITDGTQTDTGTVTVTVSDPTNDAPTAVNDTVNATEDQAVVISVIGNDTDPNDDPLIVFSTSQPSSGTVQVNPDQTITYTPDANTNGPDSFTYTITDSRGGFSQATVDVNVAPVPDAPVAVDDTLSTAIDTGLPINVQSDLLGNDFDPDDDTLSFAGFTQPTNGTLVDNGDGTLTYTPNAGFQGTDTFTYDVSDGTLTSTATVSIGVDNTIVVWYGDTQTFGQPGEAQRWVNILGEVDTSTVSALSYTLNGGPERALSIGADGRRLQNEGDFNIDIDYAELDGSAVDDIVTIRATLGDGSVVTKDVTIDYVDGSQWSSDYSIDWSTVTDPQDALQIVDGLWSHDANGIRPVETGYDRLLAIGDNTWDNYEVTVNITMNDLSAVDPVQGINGALGFGMLWDGHSDDPVAGYQPKAGWLPIAAFVFRDGNAESRESDWTTVLDIKPLNLQEGLSYEFKFRIEQVNVMDRMYSLKVWEEGTAEPTDWLIQEIEQFSAPATGTLAPFVHYWDVTIGDITVTEIEGSDIVPGQDTSDVIVAVDTGQVNPGLGEIDVLSGGAGSDTFVFGEAGTVYYDDGVGTTDGLDDYALIWDFETGVDQIQLVGSSSDYLLVSAASGLPTGTAIYRTTPGETDELLGIVNNTFGLSLASSDFVYDDTIV